MKETIVENSVVWKMIYPYSARSLKVFAADCRDGDGRFFFPLTISFFLYLLDLSRPPSIILTLMNIVLINYRCDSASIPHSNNTTHNYNLDNMTTIFVLVKGVHVGGASMCIMTDNGNPRKNKHISVDRYQNNIVNTRQNYEKGWTMHCI